MEKQAKPYMNSYLAGFLLGLVLLASFVVTGRGLGASGTAKSTVILWWERLPLNTPPIMNFTKMQQDR